ncbi:hypothetical protein AVEN_6094-1 [Araneus ventricosus]|uniref:Uncharacterized protein n=1 Tax=Araneus ventricosus TaxID=182803 RepID=A0A4Y2GUZ6_ARAVE|nr:hypothetical protein AVEN_6094-1 [Araneus ventricosus]
MCSQNKKSSGLRSGERGGQVTGPTRPIHRAGYVAFKKCQSVLEKCAGAPSCIHHMSLWMGSGKACNKLRSTCSKKICTSHTVKQKGMDAKHEDSTSSGFQRVVFQVILPSPELIDDCERPERLSSQTAMQNVREMYERQKWKSESWRNLQQRLPQVRERWHTKWVFLRKWRGVFYTRNACTPTRCNVYTKMIIPAGQTLCSGCSGMRDNDPRFPALVLFSVEETFTRGSAVGIAVRPNVLIAQFENAFSAECFLGVNIAPDDDRSSDVNEENLRTKEFKDRFRKSYPKIVEEFYNSVERSKSQPKSKSKKTVKGQETRKMTDFFLVKTNTVGGKSEKAHVKESRNNGKRTMEQNTDGCESGCKKQCLEL